MASQLILITGVSGYIGFKTMILALEAGYRVRAVIRKAEQASKLIAHPRVQAHTTRLEFVTVPDLSISAAFDPFLTGVSGILHLASPLAIQTEEFDRDIVQPAIDVTNSVMEAAKRNPSVKRVVMTSSAKQSSQDSRIHANRSAEHDINSNPTRPFQNPMEAYWASKALSRIASKAFITEHKPNFDLVNLLPSVVIGPDELAIDTASLLSGTRTLVMGPILGQKADMPLLGIQVHVDDVARAHVDALKASVPGNSDYILTSDGTEGIQWDDAKAVIAKAFPDAVGLLPLNGSLPTMKITVDASTTDKAFGWKCQSFAVTMEDLVRQYLLLLDGEKK